MDSDGPCAATRTTRRETGAAPWPSLNNSDDSTGPRDGDDTGDAVALRGGPHRVYLRAANYLCHLTEP